MPNPDSREPEDYTVYAVSDPIIMSGLVSLCFPIKEKGAIEFAHFYGRKESIKVGEPVTFYVSTEENIFIDSNTKSKRILKHKKLSF